MFSFIFYLLRSFTFYLFFCVCLFLFIFSLGTENARMCTICKKMFSSTGNRRKHEKQIHGLHQNGTIRSIADANSPLKPINGMS